MVIDALLALILILAIFRGYSKGLIVGIFSFLSILIGLAAAVKLSAWVAREAEARLQWHSAWLPFLSFLAVLLGVILLVRLVANMLQTLMEVMLAGWLNKAGGILMYCLLYGTLFSTLLFYLVKIQLVGPDLIKDSHSYPYIQRVGPTILEWMGKLLPIFKGMLGELSNYFDQLKPVES
ncbi:MAG: CvpA family protein [Chitinophagaceae bacterium]|jgi:membrane protein required for colicin V production|nr:CvpA family protein [Chitinophagaceae bacterium]MCA6487045.1 CvpA family protein [Chitinophagaceae bacterium]MCA6489292.1 CvpA family protein [Chitinophagaceae bacterium]MCA6495583.1 CvpA family protein [Chitinophagaceae bacterium]MCA6499246.1 CvpA family protein [Chitinophagaceae bacterium]